MRLNQLLGLGKIKGQITRDVVACKKLQQPLGHSLLTGLGGTGKTTIGRAIADELGFPLIETEAAEFKTRDNLNDCLTRNSKKFDSFWILFIDEIHRLNTVLQESLYYPMAEYVLNSGDDRIKLKPFTLIGATTRQDILDQGSFITRFKNIWDVGRYSLYDMEQIVKLNMNGIGLKCNLICCSKIAKRCLGIPRNAVKLCEKIRNQVLYSHSEDMTVYSYDIDQVMLLEEMDSLGLSKIHRKYLDVLKDGEAKGIGVLSSVLGRHKSIIEDTVEPILISLGFVTATPRGRKLTESGMRHLVKNRV